MELQPQWRRHCLGRRRRVTAGPALLPLLRLLGLLVLLALGAASATPAVKIRADGGDVVESREKPNTYIRRCPLHPPPGSGLPPIDMFPLDQDPALWPSCEDAYELSWRLDPRGHLAGLTEREVAKLARSMGFCPHRRCQLADVGNSGTPGECPHGLCYTKLEQGAPTYGACCFDGDGAFNAGQIIGFHHLLRATPKPIYKRNRVVLGGDPGDETMEGFINANEVLPGLILTQCPITEGPFPTLPAFERMLHEQRVGLVLQIDPFVANDDGGEEEAHERRARLLRSVSKRGCGVWPAAVAAAGSASAADVDVDFGREAQGIVSFSYPVAEGGGHGVVVKHHWYRRWRDFTVPGGVDDGVVLGLAREAAEVIRQGRKVVVACHSGRGRSGTLAALVAGILYDVRTTDRMVDLIVTMRESRDGLVETPKQWAYVRRLLDLQDGSGGSGVLSLLRASAAEWLVAGAAARGGQELLLVLGLAGFLLLFGIQRCQGRQRQRPDDGQQAPAARQPSSAFEALPAVAQNPPQQHNDGAGATSAAAGQQAEEAKPPLRLRRRLSWQRLVGRGKGKAK